MNTICRPVALIILLFAGQHAWAQNFITQWNLATAGSGATQLSFGTATSGSVNYTWQEISPGSASGSGSWNGATLTITGLPAGAIIRLQIEPTNFQRIIINTGTDRNRLTRVEQWGTSVWTSMQNAFSGCANLQVTATDVPDLSGVTIMSGMFRFCTTLNSPTNIGSWNTSVVTDMSALFSQASAFNQNISAWNTGAVTNMSNLFADAAAFNQDIGVWNTASVINMAGMFAGALVFNRNIGAWNTAAVNNMSSMFFSAYAFNQNISGWNTAAVTNMSSMFGYAHNFNQNIGTWNTSVVTSMSRMFEDAFDFNQNIGVWNTSAVTNMRGMFIDAYAFNQNIGTWNTSAVTDMSRMFDFATAFNQNIGAWNTAAVTNMSGMFADASDFNQNIGTWSLNPGVNLTGMFNNSNMDCSTYSATVTGWNANPATPNGRTLGATGRQYGTNAVAARTNLTTTKGWTITGDTPSGALCGLASPPTITSFAPSSGSIGTTVIITGNNFSSTPANNIIYFGAARAIVTAASTTALTVTVPVGATYEPITVTVDGLTGYSTHRFIFTHSGGSIGFNDKICFSVGSSPREVAIADLNNDGHLDLIVSRTDVATAILLFGNGDGTFQPPISLTTGSGGALTVGDFSGDGALDLAFANYSGSANATTSVLINDGEGNFPATDTYFLSNPPVGVGSGAVYIADADFNLDGYVDLVSAIDNIPGSLSVILNNGTSFDAKIEYQTNDNYPYSVTTSDLNNDSYPDWVIANFFSQTTKVFINNGSGGVASETTYATGSGTHEVELADLNKDGHLDLIAINATANTLSVLLNDGSGSFGAKTDYVAGSGYQPDVELADIDGDGNLDAVAGSSSNETFVMKGDGAGGFGSPQSFEVGSSPYGIVIGDLDEDGEPDIATANFADGTLCILLSKPILPPVITPATLTTQIGGIVTIDLIPLITTSNELDVSSLSFVEPPASGALASIDEAGLLTINYTGLNFSGRETFSIQACDQLGNCSTASFEVEVGGEITVYNAISPNGDGLNDTFFLQYIDILPNTASNQVSIFNRWGDLVFKTTNYNNQDRVFKGLSNSGKELPSGTYYYKIEFSGKTKTGYLSLKR